MMKKHETSDILDCGFLLTFPSIKLAAMVTWKLSVIEDSSAVLNCRVVVTAPPCEYSDANQSYRCKERIMVRELHLKVF